MVSIVTPIKTRAEKTTRTTTDTILFTAESIKKWKRPSFQRDIKRTVKFDELVSLFKTNGGVFPGVLTLGILDGDSSGDLYKIDGNHRCEAFEESGTREGVADVRYFRGTMEDFAEEWVRLNGQISATRPDDLLRAAATNNPKIGKLRSACRVIGFGVVKKRGRIGISMSSTLRAWNNAGHATPASRGKAASAILIIRDMSDSDLDSLIALINACESAWGRDPEYAALWGQMNLTMVMWIYNRIVARDPDSPKLKRLPMTIFEKCLMSLSADAKYVEWLRGRNGGVHRSPCYVRVKEMFVRRIREETGLRANLPTPEWVNSH